MRKKDKVASSFCGGGLVDGGRGRGRGAIVRHFGDVDYVFCVFCVCHQRQDMFGRRGHPVQAL